MVMISNASSASSVSSSGSNAGAAQNGRAANANNNSSNNVSNSDSNNVGGAGNNNGNSNGSGANSSNSSANQKQDASAVVSSLGFGTTLPLSTLLTGLMQVASIPLHNYQHQQDGVKTELSAYAQLKSSLTTFQSSLGNLTLAANFKSLTSNSSDKNVLNADVFTGAQPGNYTVDVKQLAQAQTLVSSGQASVSSAVGSGKPTVLSFNFGTIGSTADDKTKSATGGTPDSDGHYGDGTNFTPTAGTSKTVKINSGNNTMGGIRDAINSAGMGVTASIVNDGSATPYKLVLTNTATGAAQAMQITVDGDAAVSSLLSFDPTDSTSQGLSQTTTAQDAKLSVNGIDLNSPSNKVASALNGFTLNLAQVGKTTLSVSDDTASIETNVSNFVTAYNAMTQQLQGLTNYDSTDPSKNGPLLGDSTASNIKGMLQRIVTGALQGSSGFSTLADVGINFNNDGTLTLDSDKLKTALGKNLPAFASLFATNATTSDSGVSYLIANPDAQAGTYDVNISRAASQGMARGIAPADLAAAAAKDQDLTVSVNGVSQNISLPKATYDSASDLATALQKAINGNTAFTTNGASVNISADDRGALTVSSTSYGATSKVDISGLGTQALFGKSDIKGKVGVDVEGTIGGMLAKGTGQTLTGATGTPVSGITLQVSGAATGERGNVSYSVGFGSKLNKYVDDATGMSGSLDTATKALNTRVGAIDKQIGAFQTHLNQVQSNYQDQFSRLNQLSVKMKTAGNMLNAQFNRTSGS